MFVAVAALFWAAGVGCRPDIEVVNRAAALAPVVVSPSQFFEGNDGPWSTFEFRVGTPAQNVRFLPGTSSSATFVVLPEGCQSAPSNCADARGELFNTSASSTWSLQGVYELTIEKVLGYNDNGEFGYDTRKFPSHGTIGLGYQGSGGPTINHSVIAGVAGTDFYLGLLGLNPHPTNFTDQNDPKPSYMTLLKEQGMIPSLSYSYTAGAPYRPKKPLGSLILGGYDTSRFQASASNFSFLSDQTRDISVGLQSISINETGKVSTLLSTGIYALIDSSVAQLWLPLSVCQAFESAFGLVYDNKTALYLLNSTQHANLLSRNPSVTFTVGNGLSGGPTVNITLPYASFDLVADYPIVANSTPYFPLRRAANDTQYTLGRTFLQEAYITVDYERSSFSVSPCIWDGAAGQIVTISSPAKASNSTSTDGNGSNSTSTDVASSPTSKLSSGAIAGIVIGVLLVLLGVIAILIWFLVIIPRRRKKEEAVALAVVAGAATATDVKNAAEIGGGDAFTSELHGHYKFDGHEAEGSSPRMSELQTLSPVSELASPRSQLVEMMSAEIHEMPGSDVPEMSGEEMESPQVSGVNAIAEKEHEVKSDAISREDHPVKSDALAGEEHHAKSDAVAAKEHQENSDTFAGEEHQVKSDAVSGEELQANSDSDIPSEYKLEKDSTLR